MEDRELILSLLPKAGRKSRPPLAQPPLPRHSADELWAEFGIRLAELGGRIGTREDAEVILARPHILDHESAEILGLHSGGEPIWDAEVGVTTADLAIAETGLVSLCPVLHLVLVPKDRIVATMAEAFTRLSDRTTVMITGPSRTADIEGILVRGVHGPGDIVVVPL